MQNFKALPTDIHVYLSEFLSTKDCAAISQTCTALCEKYKNLRWRHCLVLPTSSDTRVPNGAATSPAIPIAAAASPQKYSWIPAHVIKTLEFDEATNNEHVDHAMWSLIEALGSPLPRAAFSSLQRVIVHLHYRATSAFIQTAWARSLAEKNGPVLDIRRPPIAGLDEDEDRESMVGLDQEHEWLLKLGKNITATHLLAESTKALFNAPQHVAIESLRDLTITITSNSNFSLAATLPVITPALANLNIHWMIPDPFNPCDRICPAIVSLNSLFPESLPLLRRCTLEIPNVDTDLSGELSLASLPVCFTAPIVSHIDVKSRALNLSQFQHCFKFPNLCSMSIILTSMVLHTLKPLPDPLDTNPTVKWNRPQTLNLVVTERSTTDEKLTDLVRYFFADKSLKKVKITLDCDQRNPSGSLFRETSHKIHDLFINNESAISEDQVEPLIIKAFDDLHSYDVLDVFVLGTCIQNRSVITNVVLQALQDPLSLKDVDQEMWDVFMVGLYKGLVYPTLVTEKILSLVQESTSLEYLNLDIINTFSRYFSPALNTLINSQSMPNLKQVLLSFSVFEQELKKDIWIKDLPLSPYIYKVFGAENNGRLKNVQACFDIQFKRHFIQNTVTDSLYDPLWDPLEISNPKFNGWL